MPRSLTNVSLSKDESELVTNAQILLTKNQIIKKVYAMFGELSVAYAANATGIIPHEVLHKPPKISRGENYEGLPYVMLDYPRYFTKDDTFAIRTFFWWGNFFSITIQLSGCYYELLLSNFTDAAAKNLLNDWYIGINKNIWLHDFGEGNYRQLAGVQLMNAIQESETLKLAKKIPLNEWDHAIKFLEKNFNFLLAIISTG